MTTTAAAHTAQPAPVPSGPTAEAPLRTPGSRLGPGDAFPEDLTTLELAQLQVLHSRVTRQLDHDYLTDPAGPHCCTTDRCQELVAELDTRDGA